MSATEIISAILGITGLISTATISIITITHFNKKSVIYEIKKKAIFRSLSLLDDYLSQAQWEDKQRKPVIKKELTTEHLTVEARECYNELILTCKNTDLITTFNKIIFSTQYHPEGLFNVTMLHDFRVLCRKELGLKKMDFDKKIIYINSVGNNLPKNKTE